MQKLDQEAVAALKKALGSTPEFYLYIVQGPPLWVTILLAGGLLQLFLQKPYMMGVVGSKVALVPTSIWKNSALRVDEALTFSKGDVTNVSSHKFGFGSYLTLTMRDGSKKRLMANSLTTVLEKQAEGLEKLRTYLGV